MIKRVALVVWWIGALMGVFFGLAALGAAASHSDESFAIFGGGAFLVICTWAVAFILGGSFWKPPKP